MSELDDWAGSVNGRYIDVDGYAGNQCWDASQSWLSTIAPGCTLWTQPSNYPGLAAGCWEVANAGTPQGRDLRKYITPIPGDQPGQPGDVVIWHHGSRLYPISHTAPLLQDRGANLYCMSQNSSAAQPWLPGYSTDTTGPAIYQVLPREGIAGFLRPNILSGLADSITPITEDDLMSALDEPIQYQGGRTGTTTLRNEIAWLAANFTTINELVKAVPGNTLNAQIPVAGEAKPRNTTLALETSWAATNFRNVPAGVWNQNIGPGNAAGVLNNIDVKPAAAPAPVDIDALAASIAAHLTTNQAHQFIVALGQALPKE